MVDIDAVGKNGEPRIFAGKWKRARSSGSNIPLPIRCRTTGWICLSKNANHRPGMRGNSVHTLSAPGILKIWRRISRGRGKPVVQGAENLFVYHQERFLCVHALLPNHSQSCRVRGCDASWGLRHPGGVIHQPVPGVRYQSRLDGGMYVREGEVSNHDWASFEIPGLPMLYADCSFGGSAYRQGNEMRWSHYFGNLDPMRLPCTLILASADARTQWLVDPTDNQSGEAWYDDAPVPGNLSSHKGKR